MSGQLTIPQPTWFVGCGNMGGAILDGWRASGLDLSPVTVIRPSGTAIEGVRVVADLGEAGPPPRLALLAFKPQKLGEIGPRLQPFIGGQTAVLSILAGVELDTLRGYFPQAAGIMRALPNLPVAARRGVTGLIGDAGDWRLKQQIGDLFVALGYAMWMADEAKLAALGSVASAGVAYVARFIAALAKAGVQAGLSEDIAQTLALETVLGTAWLEAMTREGMDSIAHRVASPKGTTQAGLEMLDHNRALDRLIAEAIEAAIKRGAELAANARVQPVQPR